MVFDILKQALDAFIYALIWAVALGIVLLMIVSTYLQLRPKAFGLGELLPAERVEEWLRARGDPVPDLDELMRDMRSMEAEATRLAGDVANYERLAELREKQVDAILLTLRKELSRESRRSLLQSVLVNAVFFGLGAGVSSLLFALGR
jgi:hypothetical protein